jgi:NAD(P)-dependent dehydrogenase (short-subunit alcohol dehydrogenase family)
LTDLVSAGQVETEYGDILGLTRAEKRIGTPQDIADIVLLVVNEKGRWITGQHISASGGVTGQ